MYRKGNRNYNNNKNKDSLFWTNVGNQKFEMLQLAMKANYRVNKFQQKVYLPVEKHDTAVRTSTDTVFKGSELNSHVHYVIKREDNCNATEDLKNFYNTNKHKCIGETDAF